jgi:hypothetical protein
MTGLSRRSPDVGAVVSDFDRQVGDNNITQTF